MLVGLLWVGDDVDSLDQDAVSGEGFDLRARERPRRSHRNGCSLIVDRLHDEQSAAGRDQLRHVRRGLMPQ